MCQEEKPDPPRAFFTNLAGSELWTKKILPGGYLGWVELDRGVRR